MFLLCSYLRRSRWGVVMVDRVQDWRVNLMQAHPRLFGIPSGRPDAARGYPNCEEGWRDLLERCCARIEAALAEGGALRVLQIKEKFGALRFYWSGDLPDAAKAKVDEAIALAVARSACTCEICGAEGRLYNRDGWLATACREHAKGELKPIRPGFENIHIVRTFGPGRFPIVSCRRYIRETDSFVDVDPKSLGLEE
jgi:hypothetical protein